MRPILFFLGKRLLADKKKKMGRFHYFKVLAMQTN